MPKLLVDRFTDDTIRQFRAAARIRNEDAWELVSAGRLAAAVYLWGYAAEMTLKAGWFSLIGFAENQSITVADLRSAVDLAKSRYQVQWPTQGRYHAIPYWAQLLRMHRMAIGRPYPHPRFGADLENHTWLIYDRWRETMRYKKNRPYPAELDAVGESARWLITNSRRI